MNICWWDGMGGWLIMGAASRIWFMGLMLVILGAWSQKVPKTGVTKIMIFWCQGPTPKNINFFFSSWYQCWLNYWKIFLGVTPGSRTTLKFYRTYSFRPKMKINFSNVYVCSDRSDVCTNVYFFFY